MNKQEAIEKLQGLKQVVEEGDKGSYNKGLINALTYALNVTKQLDEPEKPVVPQFVADMIVKRKRAGQSVVKAIENLRFYEDACKWVRNNGETFVKAWLYGYEVEKEKLYTVELPNSNNLDHLMLQKDRRGKISIAWYCTDSWREDECVRLTEAEIKEDYGWAWQFAKEVEE